MLLPGHIPLQATSRIPPWVSPYALPTPCLLTNAISCMVLCSPYEVSGTDSRTVCAKCPRYLVQTLPSLTRPMYSLRGAQY
eukprot:1171522-Rhodomonas_salina.1